MKRATVLAWAAALVIAAASWRMAAQAPPAQGLAARQAQALAPELRARAAAVLAEPDEDKRADALETLLEDAPVESLDFILAVLEEDPSPDVRENIIDELEDATDPRIDPALERRVAMDPDPEIVAAALEVLRLRATAPLLDLLERRLAEVRTSGDAEQFRRLAEEHERWTTIVRGGLLPTFMQEPPPVFAAAGSDRGQTGVRPGSDRGQAPGGPAGAAGPAVRVLAFGDFGDGSEAQRLVAAAIRDYHAARRFDFGVTLGDNFYSVGMLSPQDERWKTWWSDLYDPLGIVFYATLGNHDWGHPNSPASEVLFTARSASWRMPATYYTFTAGPAQFFALDTDVVSEKQLLWLKDALNASTARWKIVYGHHPIYSAGRHEDNEEKIEQLLPVLRDRADIYLAGHDHDMQHLKPEGRLHFFVAGSGGKLRPIEPGPRSLFAKSAHGFAVLEIQPDSLSVVFVGTKGEELYRYELR